MNKKKVLFICLAVLDVAVVTFLFVVHIIMLANVVGKSPAAVQEFAKGKGLFPYLAGHLYVYGFAFVVPLFLILAANIVGLVIYIRKSTQKEKVAVSDLTDEEKEALKTELLKDLQSGSEDK